MPRPRKSSGYRITWRVTEDLEPFIRRYVGAFGGVPAAMDTIVRRYRRSREVEEERLREVFAPEEFDWLMRILVPPVEGTGIEYITAQVSEAVRLGQTDGVDGESVLSRLVRLSDAELFALDEHRRRNKPTQNA